MRGLGPATIRERGLFHLAARDGDPAYLTVVGEVARQALERWYVPGMARIVGSLAKSHLSGGGTKNGCPPCLVAA